MTTLNDICEFIVDCPHTTAKDEGTGYPLVRTPNIGRGRLVYEGMHRVSKDVYDKRNARAVPRENDLIFAREATAGNVALIRPEEKVCLGQRTVLIRPNQDYVDPNFLTYYLLAPEQQHNLLSTANGATVAHVNLPAIRGLKVELPTMVVQRKIASVLEAYDALIDNCKRQIALLEETAHRLYKEWFVDMRFPGHESASFGEDGLPEGWATQPLTSVIAPRYGKDHKELGEGALPVYGSGGIMRYADKALYTGEAVLIPRKGSLNNIFIVNESFWTVDTMFYAVPVIPHIAKLAYFLLRSIDMYSFNVGAAVPSMTVNILNNIKITVPDDKTRENFEIIVNPFFERMDLAKQQIRKLTEARDLLLPRLISGQINIESAIG